ncbi:glycosyltransferase [Terriglobus sp. TAA 43]|uniref:CgeB family protein n=1 Tax=Terriglobus sp. TAA 43 TaxID=278961 RepID=UPI0006487BDE|nr:glycosyltransferase [Terriglobus sp. TAA 43]
MRILYAGQITSFDSAWYRILALRREGHEVFELNTLDYRQQNPLLQKIEFRLVWGPEVERLNRDILSMAESLKPDVVWADKVLFMKPSTLQRLRKKGIVTVSYMIDNFFGPRRDPGWRLYAKTIPYYDLHCTQRDVNVTDYKNAGARDVIKIQTAFEPTLHFPHDPPYTDARRDRGVSFIGTSYDQRAQTLLRLHADGVPVAISGGPQHWRGPLGKMFDTLYCEGELFQQQYREAIWRSKINLSFLTHSNQDEFVHKSFEITACGGFLLAERSAGHLERFVEDEEAVFFEGYDELLAKIRLYLPDEAARNRIALAGMKRAWSSGYDNDTQVRRIVERVQTILEAKKGGAA